MFFLISLKEVFNPLCGIGMFKDLIWKKKENPNKPSALAVQDGICTEECWNENCNNFRVKVIYIFNRLNVFWSLVQSSQRWIWKEWNTQKNRNFPSEAQFARTCSTWNISGKYHYKPLLNSRKLNSPFLYLYSKTFCVSIKNARFFN